MNLDPRSRSVSRRRALVGLGAACAALPARAQPAGAPPWPSGPITIHTAYLSGGTSHNLGSVTAAQMSIQLRTDVVLQSLPDKSPAALARLVAESAPDGRTALLVSNVFIRSAIVNADAGYDPLVDFKPVGLIASTEFALVANARAPFHSLSRMIELARGRATPLRVASFGQDSTAHSAAEQLQQLARIPLEVTHYRGQSPAVAALLAGDQDLSFVNMPELLPLVRQKRVVVLATAGKRRSPQLAHVPTFTELGYPITFSPWYGLVVPASTPDAVVLAFNRALREAVDSGYLQSILLALGAAPRAGTPADMRDTMAAEAADLRRILRRPAAAPRRP